MKFFLSISFLFLLITSCNVQKKPVFVKVDTVKVLSVTANTVRLHADVLFKNPNHVGGTFFTDGVKVIINDTELAQVSSEKFKVPARKQFTVPLKIVIPTKEIFEKNKNGILGGLLNSVMNKSVKVQLKGDIEYTVLGYSSVYPIDNVQELKIKL